EEIELPYIAPYSYHIFNYYTIRLRNPRGDRDKLRQYLNSQGIATAIYYPISLHLQEVYKSLGGNPGGFPESERAQEEVLTLPMYPELNEEQIGLIAKTIQSFFQSQAR
ncbi:MAG: DegT/DnrJ/EryC1/StrS family aminotransferase, partial [Desulfobacteraceae bacterium]|nr:DegT/DnrJ/EryC1/StrS family aminotransferase [Desulfobacteraceae bacterium]